MTRHFLSFLLLCPLYLFSQSTITEIDTIVNRQNHQKNEYSLKDHKIENGQKTIFYENEQPVIISVTESGEIEKNVSWHYLKGSLVFTETQWIKASSGNVLYTSKSYHYGGHMIALLEGEEAWDSSSQKYLKAEKEINACSKKLLQAESE